MGISLVQESSKKKGSKEASLYSKLFNLFEQVDDLEQRYTSGLSTLIWWVEQEQEGLLETREKLV